MSTASGPFGSTLRFALLAATEEDTNELRGLGTYGFVRHPQGFVVGAAERDPRHLEDYGYVMERIILKATDLGIGTCWLGASFSRSRFAQKIGLRPEEIIPAVCSVGYSASNTGTVERLVQWSAKARTRLPWETLFFNGTFSDPLTEEAAGRFAAPLQMVRLGPSASNKQPWRLVQESESRIHLYLQRSERYNRQLRILKIEDLPRVDMGIAMAHLEASCLDAGIPGHWLTDEPSLGPLPERVEYIATFQAGAHG